MPFGLTHYTTIVQYVLKKHTTALLFVNNRLESYAPGTIAAIVDGLKGIHFATET